MSSTTCPDRMHALPRGRRNTLAVFFVKCTIVMLPDRKTGGIFVVVNSSRFIDNSNNRFAPKLHRAPTPLIVALVMPAMVSAMTRVDPMSTARNPLEDLRILRSILSSMDASSTYKELLRGTDVVGRGVL